MKAALAANGKMVWKDVPDPIVRKNDVLVKIYATALNRADLLQKNGAYPSPEGWPAWPGLELAGTVEEMGQTAREKSGLHIGDRCALWWAAADMPKRRAFCRRLSKTSGRLSKTSGRLWKTAQFARRYIKYSRLVRSMKRKAYWSALKIRVKWY